MPGRVAVVATSTADISGRLLAVQLSHLLQRGWDTRVFCKGTRWTAETALMNPRLRGHIALAPRARARASPFDRRVRRLAPDLVHFHSGWAARKALPRGYPPRAQVAISLRDDGQDLEIPDAELVQARANVLLFGHQAALERAVARGWPGHRSVVLTSPVIGLDDVRPSARTPGCLRILSAGPMIWEQGFEHSVHAVRLLLDAGIECRYRIVGEGDHIQAVAFARHQLGLADRVELISPGDGARLAHALRDADVFVDPAVTDTCPPAALQAASACGLPAVITVRGGLAGAIEVPRRDPRALAEALRGLATDDTQRASLGASGLRVAQAALAAHLGELEDLYRFVIGAGA